MEISIANLVHQHQTKLLREVQYPHKKEYVSINKTQLSADSSANN